jgi:hypothetical protein
MKTPKFAKGDAVHISYTTLDEHVVSADTFEIIEVHEILTQRGKEYVYNLKTPDGRIIKGFLESKLTMNPAMAPKQSPQLYKPMNVFVGGKPVASSKQYTSDELLDEYNYQMRMYELTRIESFKEAADLLREEWETLYGKGKQTGAI